MIQARQGLQYANERLELFILTWTSGKILTHLDKNVVLNRLQICLIIRKVLEERKTHTKYVCSLNRCASALKLNHTKPLSEI